MKGLPAPKSQPFPPLGNAAAFHLYSRFPLLLWGASQKGWHLAAKPHQDCGSPVSARRSPCHGADDIWGLCDFPVGFGSVPVCQICPCVGKAWSYSTAPFYSFCSASCELPPCHGYGVNWISFSLGLVFFWHSQPASFLLEGSLLILTTPQLDPAHVGVGRWSVCNGHYHPPHPGDR